MLVFDEEQLPVPPYGEDWAPAGGGQTGDPPAVGHGKPRRPEKLAIGEDTMDDKTAHSDVGGDPNSRRGGVSFTKVNRGDWI